MDLIQQVAHRAYVLEKARIIATLGPTELRGGKRLAEYLTIKGAPWVP